MDQREALENVVKAWEALPDGWYGHRQLEAWIRDQMWHSINDAREALGKPRTDIQGAEKCPKCGWFVAHDGRGKGCHEKDCHYSTRPSRYSTPPAQ